jgi:uncharacterized protein YheU (UPF0270 family)
MTQTIKLTKGYEAIVDDEFFEEISRYTWYALDGHWRIVYAARWKPKTKPRITIRMHHVILGVDPLELKLNNLITDHIDRDGLNNQKHNLRITTRRENILNSVHCDNASGIYYEKGRDRYKLFKLPDHQYIGTFKTYEETLEAKRAHT